MSVGAGLSGLLGGAELITGILGGSAVLGLIKLIDVVRAWRLGARTIERDVLADAEAARARAEERVTAAEAAAERATARAWWYREQLMHTRALYLCHGGDLTMLGPTDPPAPPPAGGPAESSDPPAPV
ncbi:hypothetical protein [Nocardiopsis dassonvillei]|uniref:hypothetical protein n=1 Tax=Nocardiopsis dassonvillei TaxID=2014 RepID=UPI0036262399